MPPDIKFLGIRFRALAQATEIEERVLGAMKFASGTDDISITRTVGHFGNPITVLQAEISKSGDMKAFLGRLRDSGILRELVGQEDRRIDENCTFHLRLDKQKARMEELALAKGRDVIDIRLKVAVYPAKRESAVAAVKGWLPEST